MAPTGIAPVKTQAQWLTALASLVVGIAFFALWFWLLPKWLGFRVDAAGAAQWRWLAAVPSVLGFAIALRCVWDFGWTGRGTPAPLAPPKRLVGGFLSLCSQSDVRGFRGGMDWPLGCIRSSKPRGDHRCRTGCYRRASLRTLLRGADVTKKVRGGIRRVLPKREAMGSAFASVGSAAMKNLLVCNRGNQDRIADLRARQLWTRAAFSGQMPSMTMQDHKLPTDMTKGASLRGNEYGWSVSAFPGALATAQVQGYACIGGQFEFRLPDGICEMYWLNADASERRANESWSEYARRSCSEVRQGFERLMATTDFKKEASNWPSLRVDIERRISDALVFVAYFVREVEYANSGN
jgi:hypothetical protein